MAAFSLDSILASYERELSEIDTKILVAIIRAYMDNSSGLRVPNAPALPIKHFDKNSSAERSLVSPTCQRMKVLK